MPAAVILSRPVWLLRAVSSFSADSKAAKSIARCALRSSANRSLMRPGTPENAAAACAGRRLRDVLREAAGARSESAHCMEDEFVYSVRFHAKQLLPVARKAAAATAKRADTVQATGTKMIGVGTSASHMLAHAQGASSGETVSEQLAAGRKSRASTPAATSDTLHELAQAIYNQYQTESESGGT